MTTILRDMNAFAEMSEKTRDFVSLALLKMQAAVTGQDIISLAGIQGPGAVPISRRVMDIITKAAVDPGKISDSTWAGNLSPYTAIAAGFLESLQNIGVFDRLLANGMKKLPFKTRVAVITTAATGSQPAEAAFAPITRMDISGDAVLDPQPVLALVVLGNELIRFGTPGTVDFLGRELRKATVKATDSDFLTGVMSGISGIGSSGQEPHNAFSDFRALVEAVTIDATSRPFFVMTPTIAKQLAFLATSGPTPFDQMGPTGGTIKTIPALVSDALDQGTIVLIDATQIAGASDTIELDTATRGDLKMVDTSVTGGQQMVSLLQTGMTALRAFRFYAFDRLRDDAVAYITGAGYPDLESGSA